jgi:hypothetical protein
MNALREQMTDFESSLYFRSVTFTPTRQLASDPASFYSLRFGGLYGIGFYNR